MSTPTYKEVMDAMLSALGLNKATLLVEQEARKAERGYLERRLELKWVEQVENQGGGRTQPGQADS